MDQMTQGKSIGLLHECTRATAQIIEESQTTATEGDDTNAPSPSPAKLGLKCLPREQLNALGDLAANVAKLLTEVKAGQQQHYDQPLADELLELLDNHIKQTYKKFYDFLYQDLPYRWRQLYTDLSFLKFNCLFASWYVVNSINYEFPQSRRRRHEVAEDDPVTKMVVTLDNALILAGGAGIKRGRRMIASMLGLLEEAAEEQSTRISTIPSLDNNFDARSSTTQRATSDDTHDVREQECEWEHQRSFSTRRIFNPELKHPMRRFESMSMDQFQRYMDEGHAKGQDGPLPFVVRGLTDDWPAMTARPWRKPAYLLSQTFGGRRLVPVEVGRSYVDEGWGQELVTFGELLRRMEETSNSDQIHPHRPQDKDGNSNSNSDSDNDDNNGQQQASSDAPSTTAPAPISYLAQHELFTQLPLLRNDIPTPDLCHTSPPPHPVSAQHDKPELALPLVNAWLGPAGTITPLHTDGYHNLLAQVVGAKYVRLYSPLDSEALAPRNNGDDGGELDEVDMSNTSAFDVGVVEGWDDVPRTEHAARDDIELEEFRGLRFWEAVLEEGDMLYVPMGWWHYVRSLSVSFSVSFWWNGDHYHSQTEGKGTLGG